MGRFAAVTLLALVCFFCVTNIEARTLQGKKPADKPKTPPPADKSKWYLVKVNNGGDGGDGGRGGNGGLALNFGNNIAIPIAVLNDDDVEQETDQAIVTDASGGAGGAGGRGGAGK